MYFLEGKVQISSKRLPKWETRVRISVYLGRSPIYAGNVTLVLNLLSGHISPQFYIVFDDNFLLILALQSNTVPKNWVDLISKSIESISEEEINSSKIYILKVIYAIAVFFILFLSLYFASNETSEEIILFDNLIKSFYNFS